jgi:hypothetical protein
MQRRGRTGDDLDASVVVVNGVRRLTSVVLAIPTPLLRASYARILALKAGL